jgi:L-lactate dehydrogenase (cytochrome)
MPTARSWPPRRPKFGIPFTLSTMSICSIEDVARPHQAPFWFQLYVMRDRDFIERLIDRAKAANCSALVLTLDLQILGQRHKDLKNGLTGAAQADHPQHHQHDDQAALVPGHAGHAAPPVRQHRRPRQGCVRHGQPVEPGPAKQFDPRLNWGDVEWIKKRWGGKLILKGIQDVEDAQLAANSGADALIVSNHGGRQLDGAQSSIEALPAIVAGGGLEDRGAHGRRHPQRPGRAEGLGPGRARHLHRPRLPLRPGRHGRGRRHQGAGDHPQGTGPDDGLLRPHADAAPWTASCCRAPT